VPTPRVRQWFSPKGQGVDQSQRVPLLALKAESHSLFQKLWDSAFKADRGLLNEL